MSDSSPQQPIPWQQPDLLALIVPQPVPAAAAATPASSPPSEPASTAVVPAVAPPPPPPPAPAPPPAPRRSPATLLILDTETTGLDPARDRCIEVGAILFAVPQRAVLSQVSFLLPVDANPAEAINGISAAVSRLPQPWQAGLQCFNAMLEASDAVLAHNAAFDRQWFGIDPLPPVTRPWICTMEDIRWPEALRLKSNPAVKDLALAHGVPVWAAHRALTDCIYLAQVLERRQDLEVLLQAALEPRHLYRALVSYAERDKAREAGFRWNQPVAGAWSRRLSEDEARALPFAVQRVDAEGPSATGPRPATSSEPGAAVAA